MISTPDKRHLASLNKKLDSAQLRIDRAVRYKHSISFTFGLFLKVLRKRYKISAKSLARKANVTLQSIREMESGLRFSDHSAKRIINYFLSEEV